MSYLIRENDGGLPRCSLEYFVPFDLPDEKVIEEVPLIPVFSRIAFRYRNCKILQSRDIDLRSENLPLMNETRWDFCRSALVTSATKPTSSKTVVDLWYRKGCKLSPSRTLMLPPSIEIPISCGSQWGLAHICLFFGFFSRPVLIMRTGETPSILHRLAKVAYRRHR